MDFDSAVPLLLVKPFQFFQYLVGKVNTLAGVNRLLDNQVDRDQLTREEFDLVGDQGAATANSPSDNRNATRIMEYF